MKREIPDLWENIEEIKYIGQYLKDKLNNEGIITCFDLIEKLIEIVDDDDDFATTKQNVKEWLQSVTENLRANECCFPGSRIINNRERSYLAREYNEKGYNAIIKLWRFYVDFGTIERQCIPKSLSGRRFLHTKYVLKCEM